MFCIKITTLKKLFLTKRKVPILKPTLFPIGTKNRCRYEYVDCCSKKWKNMEIYQG